MKLLRAFAVALTGVMIFSSVPVEAFAEEAISVETLAEAETTVNDESEASAAEVLTEETAPFNEETQSAETCEGEVAAGDLEETASVTEDEEETLPAEALPETAETVRETDPVESETVPVVSDTEDDSEPMFSEEAVIDSGDCSDWNSSVSWTLTGSGNNLTLTISGTGDMEDYIEGASGYEVPWRSYRARITKLVVNSGVTSLGDSAFYGLNNLTSVSLPNTLATIGFECFERCVSLESITIPNSVSQIWSSAFSYCSSLKTISIPEGISELNGYMFQDCTSLTSVTLPQSLTEIDSGVFSGCRSLSSVTIPSKVIKIGYFAFMDCTSLTSISVPSMVTEIGEDAFSGCSRVRFVSIPKSVAEINADIFYDMTSLQAIYYSGTYAQWKSAYVCEYEWYEIPSSVQLYFNTTDTPAISSLTNSGSTINISWNAIPGATKYRVYYRAGSGSWATLPDVTGTSTALTSASDGTTYTFRVRGYMHGAWGPLSVTKSISLIGKPTVTASNVDEGVQVNWSSVAGASSYRVFYRQGSGDWVIAGNTSGNSMVVTGLTAGRAYTFRVRALVNGQWGGDSNYPAVTRMTTLSNVTLTNVSNGVRISWGSLSGASKYRIYYRVAGTSGWTTLPDVTGTSYTMTFSKLKGRTQYEFAVRGVATDGSLSTYRSAKVLTQFSDVTNSSANYYLPVYWAVDQGITTGWSDGTFRPLNNCNRATVVAFLWRMAGEPRPAEVSENPFSDVDESNQFYNAILWAVQNGITTGWPDGTFRPWNNCNRASIVTFLWRYMGEPDPDTVGSSPFTDVPEDDPFYLPILWASQNGITTGWSDGTFRPYNICNRGAVVTFLYRLSDQD